VHAKFTPDGVTRLPAGSVELLGSPIATEEPELITMYEITVRGEAGPTVRSAFDDLAITVADGLTILSGELPDQAALFGVLARVQDLGLKLVGVRQLNPGSAGPPG
jgi:hypothetical protein